LATIWEGAELGDEEKREHASIARIKIKKGQPDRFIIILIKIPLRFLSASQWYPILIE
jgi:hypothetical protein